MARLAVCNSKAVTLVTINSNSCIPCIPIWEDASISFRLSNCWFTSPCMVNKGCTLAIASCVIPFSSISFLTPSAPILSSLSKATVKSISISSAPITWAIPASILRLFIFITVPFSERSVKTASYNCTNSTSCNKEVLPTTSASHW